MREHRRRKKREVKKKKKVKQCQGEPIKESIPQRQTKDEPRRLTPR